VALYRLRLADLLSIIDGLCVSSSIQQLADTFSVLPQHRLLISDDLLSVVIEFDDGVWRLRFQ